MPEESVCIEEKDMKQANPKGGGGGGASSASVGCLRLAVCLLAVTCIILLVLVTFMLQQEFSIRIVRHERHIIASQHKLSSISELVDTTREEEEQRTDEEMRVFASTTSPIQTSASSSSSVSSSSVIEATKERIDSGAAAEVIGDDILVRVVHPSGSGGTTLCKVIKHTKGARLSSFQGIHNCNERGSGPKTFKSMKPDSPWRRCDSAMKDGVRKYNWLFLEYAFDVDYPCAPDKNVKHVMLFRDPWERLYSIMQKSSQKLGKWLEEYAYYLEMKDKSRARVDSGTLRRIDNSLIRFLLGRDKGVAQIPFGGVTRAHLEAAKKIVDDFDLVMETSDLDNVSALLSDAFGKHFTFPQLAKRENIHEYTPKPNGYARLKDLFLKHNTLELEFYEYLVSMKAKKKERVKTR